MGRGPSISKDEIFYSVRAVAERTSLSESTIRRAIRDGELQALKIRGSIRIRKSGMDAWALSE
jgi:excisionase family DNA binding protein